MRYTWLRENVWLSTYPNGRRNWIVNTAMACIAAFIVGFALVAIAGCTQIGTPIQARLPQKPTPTTVYQGNTYATVTCHWRGSTFQTDVATAIDEGFWPKYCKLG